MTHRLFEKQLQKATRLDGSVDIDALSTLVSDAYLQNDRNRDRTERSISLMVEELDDRHREVEGRGAELSRQNTLFRDAIENIGHGLSMYDGDNRLVVFNERYVTMYGLKDLDVQPGMSSEAIRLHFNRSGLFVVPICSLDELSAGPGLREDEYHLVDGRIIQVSRHPRVGGGWVMMHRDVTATRQLEKERAGAEEAVRRHRELEYKAEMSNKAKAEFLAVMSHEIRTPLNAVLGLTTTLLDTTLTSSQRESLEMIDTAGSNLLHLLNDILDFSKLDAGRMDFESQPFSPNAIVDSVFSIAKVAATRKSLQLRIVSASDMPDGLLGDADRIRQVINNLASNAVKFTERGEVVIGSRLLSQADGAATVEFWVTDTGIGIAEDQVARLFQNFAQADSTIARRYGGTGLGLAICKKIIEQMGGEISVSSRKDVGSTFSFKLHLPVASLDEVTASKSAPPSTDLHQLLASMTRPVRILLAEDNVTNQVVFRKMLAEFGVELHVASNGLEALASFPQVKPDVIYMDMQMPEMNGIEATRHIRRLGEFGAMVPIVAVSANAYPEDINAYREAGMNDFIAKPIRRRQLVEHLASIVQLTTHGDRPAAVMATAPDAPADLLDIDQSVLDELESDIGADGVEEAFRIFIDDQRSFGAPATANLDDGERARIRAEAHALKGSAGMFGFSALTTLAKKLEQSAATMSPEEHANLLHQIAAAIGRIEAAMNKESADSHERRSLVA